MSDPTVLTNHYDPISFHINASSRFSISELTAFTYNAVWIADLPIVIAASSLRCSFLAMLCDAVFRIVEQRDPFIDRCPNQASDNSTSYCSASGTCDCACCSARYSTSRRTGDRSGSACGACDCPASAACRTARHATHNRSCRGSSNCHSIAECVVLCLAANSAACLCLTHPGRINAINRIICDN